MQGGGIGNCVNMFSLLTSANFPFFTLGGSISAEHGIGCVHAERLECFKPAFDLRMMRTLKDAFDPMNLTNPGKVLRDVPSGG